MLLPTAIIFGFDSLSPLCHYSTVQRWGNIIFYGVGSCGVMLREEKKYDEGQALTYQYSKYKIPILVAIESKKLLNNTIVSTKIWIINPKANTNLSNT
jgi:hypothetical protein